MADRPQTFGDLLRRLRVEARLTQEELAERAGMSVRGVSDLERGRNRFPYRATVLRLVDVLRPSEAEVEGLWALAARRRGPTGETAAPTVRLPHPITSILGRAREQQAVLHALRWEGMRLVTLTGPGGVGKTRLALQVGSEAAGDYADGVTFVSLGAITDAALVPSAMARALELHPTGTSTPEQALFTHLAARENLLVLDNFEQLLPAARFVADLLSASPRLKVLVTSRAPLQVRGEQQIDLTPLALPSADVASEEDLVLAPATALFLERARAADADLRLTPDGARAITDICRHLDGLPLAIELAAALVKYQSPQALLQQLERRFDALAQGGRDLPVRQQTLRNTIDWSYRLLGADEQTMLRRLSVFAGGATLDAAIDVCADGDAGYRTAVYALRDLSLLVLDRADPEVYRIEMLETVHAYALELLSASGEMPALRDRHQAYFLDLARQAESHLTGPQQATWFARLEAERDNLRSALGWAYDQERVRDGLRILVSLRIFWEGRGLLGEPRRWLERFLALGEGGELEKDEALHARALGVLGRLCWWQNDVDLAEPLLNRGLAIARAADDILATARILNNLAGITHERGDAERAMALYQDALAAAIQSGDRWHLAAVYTNLGNLASDERHFEQARTWLEQGLALLREMGEKRIIGMNLNVLGEVFREQGLLDAAAASFREALEHLQEIGDSINLAYSLECLARVARDRQEMERAAELVGAADRIRQDLDVTVDTSILAARADVLRDCARVLGTERIEAARERGSAMPLDVAIAYALYVREAI